MNFRCIPLTYRATTRTKLFLQRSEEPPEETYTVGWYYTLSAVRLSVISSSSMLTLGSMQYSIDIIVENNTCGGGGLVARGRVNEGSAREQAACASSGVSTIHRVVFCSAYRRWDASRSTAAPKQCYLP